MLAGGGVVVAGAASYGRWVEPYWVEYLDLPMPLPRLNPALDGFRITHLTDLHSGDRVPLGYLAQVVERVNAINPDLAVITGDLVTRDSARPKPVAQVLAKLRPRCVVSFGNHDYDVVPTSSGRSVRLEDELQRELTAAGLKVLRNEAIRVERNGAYFWLAGLEDLWSGRFSPQLAFAGVDRSSPIVALSHNPDTAAAVAAYGADWILAGHTHGGQIRIPGLGAPLLPVQDTRLDQGLFDIGAAKLYVSRGVGFLAQVRMFCRPEVPTFTLRPAGGGHAASAPA